MENNYGGAIWTKHALKRMREREIRQGDAWATFRSPDESRFAKSRGGWVYTRRWGEIIIEVIAKKDKENWVILSVWSKKLKSMSKIKKDKVGLIAKFKNFLKF
jgi:hypothetical protein